MCGRYHLADIKGLHARYKTKNDLPELKPNYNVAPGQFNPVVDRESPNKLELMKWGLIPSWAKDQKIGYKMINARSETVTQKPSFRKSFKVRRCLIPSNGFYEWDKKGGTKKPYHFFLKDISIFSFSGLWDEWKNPLGQTVRSYTILTTTPNKIVESFHDRMPVIIDKKDEETWLNSDSTEIELMSLLKPYPAQNMDYYEISTMINSPRNQGRELISKVDN